MVTARPHAHGDVEPLPPLDLIRRRHEFRRVFRVRGAAHLLVFGRELLFLPGEGRQREPDREKNPENAASHGCSSSGGLNFQERASESTRAARGDCTAWPGTRRRPRPGPADRRRSARRAGWGEWG